jgi:hypothetical protein
MNTYLVLFESSPFVNSPHFGRFARGFWTIWVVAADWNAATERASDYIAEQGWRLDAHKGTRAVQRANCGDDPELLNRFDEAQQLGISAILDTSKMRVETN